MKFLQQDGMFDRQRMTDCCGRSSTYCDHALCCKGCYREVEHGQGDGGEYLSPDGKTLIGHNLRYVIDLDTKKWTSVEITPPTLGSVDVVEWVS